MIVLPIRVALVSVIITLAMDVITTILEKFFVPAFNKKITRENIRKGKSTRLHFSAITKTLPGVLLSAKSSWIVRFAAIALIALLTASEALLIETTVNNHDPPNDRTVSWQLKSNVNDSLIIVKPDATMHTSWTGDLAIVQGCSRIENEHLILVNGAFTVHENITRESVTDPARPSSQASIKCQDGVSAEKGTEIRVEADLEWSFLEKRLQSAQLSIDVISQFPLEKKDTRFFDSFGFSNSQVEFSVVTFMIQMDAEPEPREYEMACDEREPPGGVTVAMEERSRRVLSIDPLLEFWYHTCLAVEINRSNDTYKHMRVVSMTSEDAYVLNGIPMAALWQDRSENLIKTDVGLSS
ncbi:hypothetical protein FGB62_36g111 [Gracilaria domingensis]|nr:hypothetical protein FGB62_36g111 [Gracilaria domingensis]